MSDTTNNTDHNSISSSITYKQKLKLYYTTLRHKYKTFQQTYGPTIERKGVRILGPILVILVELLLTISLYIWFHSIVQCSNLTYQSYITIVALGILFILYYTHIKAVLLCKENYAINVKHIKPIVDDNERSEYINNNTIHTVCKHCHIIKPSRAHHCSICDKCVLKMDHHCVCISTTNNITV